MRTKAVAIVGAIIMCGSTIADVIFTTGGFELPTYTNGTVAAKNVGGSKVWVEWDQINSVNNANPGFTVVQSAVVKNGSQALAIADVTNRVIARVVNLNVTNAISYWSANYKSESTNDLGKASIALRSGANILTFSYDVLGGKAVWYSATENTKRTEVAYGTWADITVGIDLSTDAYTFYLNGASAFTGTLGTDWTKVDSWEVDVVANAATRSPKGPYAFYVDDLQVTTVMIPEPATIGLLGMASVLLLLCRRHLRRG